MLFSPDLFIHFWVSWVFLPAHGISLVTEGRDCSSLWCTASHCSGFSCCRAQAQLSRGMRNPPGLVTVPMSPAPAGRFSATGLPGQKKSHRCIEQSFGFCGRRWVGWSERIALKHVYYQLWNKSPVQVWCMRQVLRAGALGWPRGMWWRGRWEGSSGRGIHINPWLIHINVWQKPLQYCKVISLQPI